MYKELLEDPAIVFSRPSHGCLEHWARQGVLLLNTSLTVRAHEAASHKGLGWEEFTDAVIDAVNVKCSGVVFLLWGKHAEEKVHRFVCTRSAFLMSLQCRRVDKTKHLILTSPHPSPLSAHRGWVDIAIALSFLTIRCSQFYWKSPLQQMQRILAPQRQVLGTLTIHSQILFL
jgi:uracil-DNA glycosylase